MRVQENSTRSCYRNTAGNCDTHNVGSGGGVHGTCNFGDVAHAN
jgi:hypothetical protein